MTTSSFPTRDDFALAVRVFKHATHYAAGRALDGVDVDVDHVWLTMYDSLLPLDPAEREVRITQVERILYAPAVH